MLLNQFHDILPGSCIKQVNVVSLHNGYFSFFNCMHFMLSLTHVGPVK